MNAPNKPIVQSAPVGISPLGYVEPLGLGVGGPQPEPSPWAIDGPWISYLGGVVIGNPKGGNMGAGALNVSALYVNGAPIGAAVISTTAPAGPNIGTLWFDEVKANLYVWYNDGNSSQWVIAVNPGFSVNIDNSSIVGTGGQTPLSVGTIDAGTF